MRLLHISDLHFGDHNEHLARSLEDRVKAIRPDLILATGDMVDNPEANSLSQARKFLEGFQQFCVQQPESDPKRPQIIAIPGNHDVRYLGNIRVSARNFQKEFARFATNYYFEGENVWVYGFNSSTEFWMGANGKVAAEDLLQFGRCYDDLLQKHEARFASAFKIVALHHHPVPIKYDDKYARWLVLANAGEFLGEVLKRRIDLILHGHEHIQAKARYGRELRTGGHQEVPIVSVGAALKRNPGLDHNRFNLITIEASGEINVACYGAEQNSFDDKPWESYPIRSQEEAIERAFEIRKTEAGYFYGGIASVAQINEDGDAYRAVECSDLCVLDSSTERASRHKVSLPATSGYIDMPRARAIDGPGLAQFRLRDINTTKKGQVESMEGMVDYGRRLTRDEKISYEYSWFAVNGFAMNERESRFKYGADYSTTEFTHFPVCDPIEELTIIVRFPDDFASPLRPESLVAKFTIEENMFKLDRESIIEKQLEQSNALRYYESLKTAALRVRRPEVGYSYGIQWKLPPSPLPSTGPSAGRIEELVSRLLSIRLRPSDQSLKFFLAFLTTIGKLLCEVLIPESSDVLEISLMVFAPKERKMVVVGGADIGASLQQSKWKDYSSVELPYGEGIGGKVFKTNQPRLYVRIIQEEERKTPDFYRRLPGVPDHAVLLALPLQNPEAKDHVYGVINCGSMSRSCQLWEIGELGGPVAVEKFSSLQAALNVVCFELLSDYFLSKKSS